MQLNTLTKITTKGKKRLGQGHGSGRVKTSGRGTKGQNARGKVKISFEGGALSLIKRMPFRRGKGKNKDFRGSSVILNLDSLNIFKNNSIVDIKTLAEKNLVEEGKAKMYGIKILGNGKINVSLTVKVPVSKSAGKKIEKAGGRVKLDSPNKFSQAKSDLAGGKVEPAQTLAKSQ